MYAAIALYVVCAVSFVGALYLLYWRVVPAMLQWWSRRYEVNAEVGALAVIVFGCAVVLLAYGTVRSLYASPLTETNARVVDESEYPELHGVVRRLATQADLPTPSIAVVPTDVPNAYTHGITPGRSTVVVTRGLLEELDDDELEAVVAHELAHVLNRDGAVMSVGYLLPAVSFAVSKALTSPFDGDERPEWDDDDPPTSAGGSASTNRIDWVDRASSSSTRQRSSSSVFSVGGSSRNRSRSSNSSSSDGDGGGGLLVAIIVLLAILVVTAILTLALSLFFWTFSYAVLALLSRTREYAADRTAVELTGDPDALASALERIDREMDGVPARDLRAVDGAVETLYVAPLRRGAFKRRDVVLLSDDLFPNTHPDTDDRIRRLREIDEIGAPPGP